MTLNLVGRPLLLHENKQFMTKTCENVLTAMHILLVVLVFTTMVGRCITSKRNHEPQELVQEHFLTTTQSLSTGSDYPAEGIRLCKSYHSQTGGRMNYLLLSESICRILCSPENALFERTVRKADAYPYVQLDHPLRIEAEDVQ